MSSPEVTLKEAVQLSGKSEKTLRRKIDAGLLTGRRDPMDYGGFMWVIDVDSLEELYPGSKEQMEELGIEAATEPPPTRLEPGTALQQAGEEEACENETQNAAPQFFVDYLMEENRALKEDLRQRDARIQGLQERTGKLERQLGEQEGTATTQHRVLEWFQQVEATRALPPGPQEVAPEPPPQPATLDLKTMVLSLMALLGTGLLVMVTSGMLHFNV